MAAPARAEQSASAPLAKESSALLDERQLDSVAARMPGETAQRLEDADARYAKMLSALVNELKIGT